MKKIIQTLLFTFLINGFIIAQNKIETMDLIGKKYTVTKVVPTEILVNIGMKAQVTQEL